jgi:hypothetical protein
MTTLLTFPIRGRPWTSAERSLLDQFGKALGEAIQCESGTTDEGDPWMVICDTDSSVVAHIARIGAGYVMIWADGTSDFGASLNRLVLSARHKGADAA